MEIEEDWIRVRAHCMEDQQGEIKVYDSEKVQLKKNIIKDKVLVEWRTDGKVVLTLRKENAPSFWKYLLKDSTREAKELQVWWEMRDKYIEVLEEYMMEENMKERSAKADEL